MLVRNEPPNRVEECIDRTISAARRGQLLAIHLQRQHSALWSMGAAIDLYLFDLNPVMPAQDLVVDERDNVLVKHRLFRIRQLLETSEGVLEGIVPERIAEFFELLPK